MFSLDRLGLVVEGCGYMLQADRSESLGSPEKKRGVVWGPSLNLFPHSSLLSSPSMPWFCRLISMPNWRVITTKTSLAYRHIDIDIGDSSMEVQLIWFLEHYGKVKHTDWPPNKPTTDWPTTEDMREVSLPKKWVYFSVYAERRREGDAWLLGAEEMFN